MKMFLIYYMLEILNICLGFLRNYFLFDEVIIWIFLVMFLFYKGVVD